MEMHTAASLSAIHGLAASAVRRPRKARGLVALLGCVVATWRRERRIRRDIRELQERDDRLLADIGVHRSMIESYVRRGRRGWMLVAVLALSGPLERAGPAIADEFVSVARGARLAITGGCHDCHTAGYNESGGKVDPSRALAGSSVGFRGPWGTTYPSNLRVTAVAMTEAGFADYARSFKALPPMPWYNLHAMSEDELRSLHRYLRSLGEVGEAAPAYVPPGEEPATAFINLLPVAPAPR